MSGCALWAPASSGSRARDEPHPDGYDLPHVKRLQLTHADVAEVVRTMRPSSERRDDVAAAVADIIEMVRHGGEEAVRVPATFTVVAGGRLTPPTITVPPFLAVELSLVAQDGGPHTLVLQTTPPHRLRVAAGSSAAVRIAGLRAGRYAVTLDGRRAGALVAGGEVGP